MFSHRSLNGTQEPNMVLSGHSKWKSPDIDIGADGKSTILTDCLQ
jgi:hypothetical protein